MLSLEGQQLGNYDVIKRIRVGGMGAVYEGRQRTAFDRRVAIKVILGDYAADRDMRRRFAREARTIARLHHPHILPLIEFGDERGILYLVMPFIEGGTLTSYLRRTLPGLDDVSSIYQQLLDAVEHAHEEGLIHRDIKSSNVLLEQRRSGPPYAYLADFGLVRTTRNIENSQTGKPIPLDQVPGTPHYMAPEQTRGIVTPLTDIYALGVLLFLMLTGELPYNDPDDVRVIQMHLHDPIPSPSDLDVSIPPELGDVVRTAMAKRPEARYQNIADLRNSFLSAVQGPGFVTQDPPVGPWFTAANAHDARNDPNAQYNGPLIEDAEDLAGGANLDLYTEPPSPPRRPGPTPLLIPEVPTIAEPQVLSASADTVVSPRRVRNTDSVHPRRTNHRPRITEEPIKPIARPGKRAPLKQGVRRRAPIGAVGPAPAPALSRPVRRQRSRRAILWLWPVMLVPIVLLALLLMPRTLGYSFFPAGFPLLGTPPVATIYVTAQTHTLQDKYLLTASPQVTQPDLVTHTIPDRSLQNQASDSRSVPATASKTLPGAQAHGNVTFINPNPGPITVPTAQLLTTPSGVRIQISRAVTVPAHTNTQDGTASVPAIAVNPGAQGNIPAHTLDGPCCNNALTIKNPAPFSGGLDPQTVHIVSQADLDGAQNTLTPKMQQQILQQLQHMLQSDEIMVGSPTYKTITSSNAQVGDQADQVQVTVNITGSISVYSRAQASSTAIQLLRTQASHSLNGNYQLHGDISASVLTATPGKDGTAYISISVSGLWRYAWSAEQANQWRQSIKGASSPAALAYLNAQPGLTSVQINLPFGTDHLPTSPTDIQIITVER